MTSYLVCLSGRVAWDEWQRQVRAATASDADHDVFGSLDQRVRRVVDLAGVRMYQQVVT